MLRGVHQEQSEETTAKNEGLSLANVGGCRETVIMQWPSSQVPSHPNFLASQTCSPPGSWHISPCHLKALGPQAVVHRPPHLVFLSGAGVPGGSNHPGKPRAGGFWKCQDHQEQQLLSLCKCEQRQQWALGEVGPRGGGTGILTPFQVSKLGLIYTHQWG